MIELKLTYDVHFHGDRTIVKEENVTEITKINDKAPIGKLMNDLLLFEAPNLLEGWCVKNGIDYYEDEGYSLENLSIIVTRNKGGV